jgi:flagellar basal-body rod protein FlgB
MGMDVLLALQHRTVAGQDIQALADLCRSAAIACRIAGAYVSESRHFRIWHGVCFISRVHLRKANSAMSDGLFGIHGAALELRSQRMGILTSNIANAATPGYKARDINFSAALKARTSGTSESEALASSTQYRVPVMPSLDGNTVEMATEQLAFSENAVGYTATLSFITDRVNTVTRALKGE